MDLFSGELTDVVHDRVPAAGSLDLDERELLGGLTLTSLEVFELAASFFPSFLFELILGKAAHSALLWGGERTRRLLIETLL